MLILRIYLSFIVFIQTSFGHIRAFIRCWDLCWKWAV